LAITDGDNNLVRNVVFDDIRVDRIEEGILFNFRVVFNQKYSLAPGRGIENIVMRRVRLRSGRVNRPVIAGYDTHRTVRDVSLVDVGGPDGALSLEDIDVGLYAERISAFPR
jgi:hypothetical protein